MSNKDLIVVRGGGDIATGTIYKLVKAGFRVLVLETENPSAIRRNVAFSEAVYEGRQIVEDMECVLAASLEQAYSIMEEGKPALFIDPSGECISQVKPYAVVDAILAKKNLGTTIDMAPVTVALGPGFKAGVDVNIVIETNRGHHLGRVISKDTAQKEYLPEVYNTNCAYPDTKTPGNICGYTSERVIHSPAEGIMKNVCRITQTVKKDEEIAYIFTPEGEHVSVKATISGLLRGLIRDGYKVTKGFKIADIDPRESEYENCFTISDKARCIAGGVLEAIMGFKPN